MIASLVDADAESDADVHVDCGCVSRCDCDLLWRPWSSQLYFKWLPFNLDVNYIQKKKKVPKRIIIIALINIKNKGTEVYTSPSLSLIQ